MHPVFFDCDTGIDDSVALLYLLAREDVDLVGIASTAGNVDVDAVTANNLAWLSLCGRTDVVVHRGAEQPIASALQTTEDTHGPRGIGYAVLPAPTLTAASTDAAQAWIDASHRHPGSLIGVVTGPCTSLASALRIDPTLAHRLRRLVIMGGAFRVHGNTTPVAEWNVHVDPEAAAEVFAALHRGEDDSPVGVGSPTSGSELPILCPLDITESMALTPEHLVRLAEAAGSSLPEVPSPDADRGRRCTSTNRVVAHLVDALLFYLEFHHDHDEGYIAHLHDVLAVMVALDPTLVDLKPARVDVELHGRLTRAMTVVDERRMTGESPNLSVARALASGIEVEMLFDDLIARLGSLASNLGDLP